MREFRTYGSVRGPLSNGRPAINWERQGEQRSVPVEDARSLSRRQEKKDTRSEQGLSQLPLPAAREGSD